MRARQWALSSQSFRLAVLCLLALGAFGYQQPSVAHDDHEPANVAIYRTRNIGDHQLLALDPRTLSDLSTDPAGEIYRELWPGSVIVSRDGSTIAGTGMGNDIQVYDGLTGSFRVTVASDGEIWPLDLSADGSKLLAGVTSDFSGQLYPPAWKVFDTTTGEMTAAIQGESDQSNTFIQAVDPISWKLYRLLPERASWFGDDRPQPAKLVAIDLATASTIGQTTLPEVLIGPWPDEFLIALPDSELGIVRIANPGIAVSPDGRELAVVHAQDDGVTVIDAATLAVERTMSLHQNQGLVDGLLSKLPLAPQHASAKSPAMGASIRAFYSADGQSLIIGGNNITFDPKAQESARTGRGLTLVDLQNGTIETKTFDEFEVSGVYTLPNGEVYVTGTDWEAAGASGDPYVIARLDGESLHTLAKRSFPIFVNFYIVPENA
jgi:DNA-binding beta-propeller fold protein YncE